MADSSPRYDNALIIYDGDCVFCQNYTRYVRLRDSVGPVELLDARSGDPRVTRYWREGYDLNEGMLFVHQGRIYHGAEAVSVLAGLSSSSTLFNRLNRALLVRPSWSRIIYPWLKSGRRLTLFLRGKGLLDAPPPSN